MNHGSLLTPEAIASYKKLMTEPKENGLDFQPNSDNWETTLWNWNGWR